MRLLPVVLLLLTGAFNIQGQEVPALLGDLKRAPSDSLKIAAFQALINHYRYSNLDSALYYAKSGLDYAQDRQYPQGKGLMMYALAQVNERHGNLNQAKDEYVTAKATFADIGFTKGVASTTNGLGVIAGRTGRYDEATRHFLEALALFEEINNTEGIVQTYIKLGVVSDHLGNLDQALGYYLKAEKLNSGNPSSNASLALLNNIGIVYGKREDLRMALRYFHRGLLESDPEKHTGIHIALLGSVGVAYQKLGITDSAWHFQQQALSMARQNDLPEEEARSLLNLAGLVSNSDPMQSIVLLNDALVITQQIHHLKLMTEVYEAMIEVRKQSNDYKLAMELSEKMQVLKDSLFTLEKSKEIANLHATQELARQENEIRNLAVQNEKSMFQRNIMIVVALIAIAMIAIVWFYNTKISNLNMQLVAKQNELRNSNNIKDKLFSILGHDLRAPLSQVIGLLNVLAIKHEDKDESAIIDKLRQQSQHTLETLDNLLMWGRSQLKGIRLNQQALAVKDQIRKSKFLVEDYAAEKDVRIVDNISSDLHVYVDASHFDFVIRNLLSNAIKFSHAGGTVAINAFSSADQHVVVSVKDAGVGVPVGLQNKIFSAGNESVKGTWNEKGTGIGLMLSQEYIRENGGRLWLESKEGSGSTFYFSLKQQNMPEPVAAFEG